MPFMMTTTMMMYGIVSLLHVVLLADAFSMFPAPQVTMPSTTTSAARSYFSHGVVALRMSDNSNNDDQDGADLAAEFFKMAQQKGVELESDDLLDEDEDEEDVEDSVAVGDTIDDDDDDDEEATNIPQGAINAFLGYDTGQVGEKLAGNVSLTDDQLYSEVKERVLDTAGGFVDYVKRAKDDDYDDDDDELGGGGEPKPYVPPLTVPDAELTAGEVVILILDALANNDNPSKNKGVEIFFGYSSPGSQIKNEQGLTPAEYADFLKETEYKVLFDRESVSIEKADYSYDGKKAFFTARLQVTEQEVVNVNFILSSSKDGSGGGATSDDDCWLVDSMLIRPQSMRRRRRK